MEILSSLAVPGSAICAAVIGVVALFRLRSTDREALSNSQRAYIETLEEARLEADARADRFRDDVDREREQRIKAEQDKLVLNSQILALNARIVALQNPQQMPMISPYQIDDTQSDDHGAASSSESQEAP